MDYVRASIPPELKVIPIMPGKTMGGIYYARYDAGSTLQYHELIVVSALVRLRWKPGVWISHIYVDDSRSEAGGREIWGLPKQQARFAEAADRSIIVSQAGSRLCTIFRKTPTSWMTLPLFAPVVSCREDGPAWFRGLGRARCGLSYGAIDVPPHSPFAALGLQLGAGAGSSLQSQRQLHLDRLDLTMYGPR